MRNSLLLVLAWTVLVSGCTADTPPNARLDTFQPRRDVLPPPPDSPPGCPTPPTLPAPTLDPYPQLTTQQRQPLRGIAPGAAQIVAQGGLGSSKPAAVGADGRFCLEVELIPDAPNTVVLTPISSNGCFGLPRTVSLTHRSSTQKDAGGPTGPQNLALGAVVSSGTTPDPGTLASLADGDAKSWAQFEMWDPEASSTCDRSVWVRFDFGKSYTITRFKLRWGPLAKNDSTYAVCYTLLLSSKSSPVDPDPAHGDWTVAKQENAGTDADQDVQVNPESARWAAVLVHENASTNFLGYETFDIAEIEVWGQDPNAVPPPPPDTCE